MAEGADVSANRPASDKGLAPVHDVVQHSGVDTSQDPTDPEEQLEMFLYKFPEVERSDITELLAEFKRFDTNNSDELEEDQAMMLLESRGETRTFRELRGLLAHMDADRNHKLNFLEWCTAHYEKDWEMLHTFTDEAAFAAAMERVKEAKREQEAARKVIADAAAEEERKAEERAKELEAEAKLTGVAGAAAFFARQMEGAQDTTKSNEQMIKEAAARRKALREAKAAERKAKEDAENSHQTKEQAEAAMAEAKAKADAEAAKIAEDAKQAERARRAANRAKMNAKWGGGGSG